MRSRDFLSMKQIVRPPLASPPGKLSPQATDEEHVSHKIIRLHDSVQPIAYTFFPNIPCRLQYQYRHRTLLRLKYASAFPSGYSFTICTPISVTAAINEM